MYLLSKRAIEEIRKRWELELRVLAHWCPLELVRRWFIISVEGLVGENQRTYSVVFCRKGVVILNVVFE